MDMLRLGRVMTLYQYKCSYCTQVEKDYPIKPYIQAYKEHVQTISWELKP